MLEDFVADSMLLSVGIPLASSFYVPFNTNDGDEVPCHCCHSIAGMSFLSCTVICATCLYVGVLAGKTQLQHVTLHCSGTYGGGTGLSLRPLLSHLQELQQLTHLHLAASLKLSPSDARCHPAAAFSALTASNKLQYLDLGGCELPEGVWQHMFPAGRQLPHLTLLDIANVRQPGAAAAPLHRCLTAATAPDVSHLISCCPSLQSLDMTSLQCSAEQLAPLQGLTGCAHCGWVTPIPDVWARVWSGCVR
jgi:hypothetical protein